MKLKLASLALLATATFASAQAPAADLEKTLVNNSTALFTAYQQMDQALFLSIIAPDFVFISHWGIQGPEELAGTVQGCSLTSFKISEAKVRQLSPDSAVLIYKAHQASSCGTKAEPADLVLTDTYVRKGADWLMSIHMQAAAEK
ncbi:protein of unknown function [Granulicella pectinivorans]|jgi:hypothetical protein|uniref:DUF4440 domain-containing protein n=1 Tax=Granulicella pectinivorans TaxID=474950 RepID=A0A1I6N1T5_9BACT|nr:nuclear transport factor 2 family protein [Granulicella pectinivorans]SFS21748.1 protein of unknown function [Granulicella pectinivorans]